MSVIASPIRYFGGKGTMLPILRSYYPPDYNLFVEPFCGSAVSALNITGVPVIINDLNATLYNFWKVLADPVMYQGFAERITTTLYHEAIREEYRALLRTGEGDAVTRAVAFFYVNRTSVNGIGGFSMNTLARRGLSKSIADFDHAVRQAWVVHQKLRDVVILNRDALEVMAKYDRPGAFIYCDPPYVHATRGVTRYDHDMDDSQQEAFVTVLLGIANAQVMISGYDNPLYTRLTDAGWHKVSFDVNTVDGNGEPKTKTEYLWLNYELPKQLELPL